MANVELDDTIKDKLKDNLHVTNDEINTLLVFFNSQLKPAIKTHYLSHLVTSVEEMINDSQKKEFLEYIKSTGKSEENISTITKLVNDKQVRLFSIILVPVKSVNRKAQTYIKKAGAIICYASYLEENEKRFAIAHELGHIVNNYILKDSKIDSGTNPECIASLFAYIALLDKNNFYQNEAKNYVSRTDIELFDDYNNVLHCSVN